MASARKLHPVFVEGLDVSAYGITRSLGRQGIPVYALNHRLGEPLRFSRYIRKCFAYPDDPSQPRAYSGDSVADEKVLGQLLLEWSTQFEHKPVLFATSDWFARFLSNQQHRLEQNFLFHWIAPDLFNTIVDKGRMAAFCQNTGVRVPRTHATSPDDDIEAVTRSFVYPCIIKPVHRYSAGFPVETAKVLIANDARQALDFFEKYPQLRGGTLMQEMIEGGDDQVFQCTALVNSNGEVTACSTVRKLRQYPPGFGSMCYGQTERNDAVTAEALKLLRALGYRGLGSLEFKYREKDGAYYFIEMNTRLPWYNGIFADAGVNLPYLAYLDLAGEPPQPAARDTQRDQTRWVSAHNYAACYRDANARRDIGRAGFISHLARANSYAWWNWSDPAPFLASLGFAARRFAGNLLRKSGLR